MKMSNSDLSILETIINNSQSKNWQCQCPGCSDVAINSHLLQKNGILNAIKENGHLIEFKSNPLYYIEKKGTFNFSKNGINRAFSYKGFCSSHDNNIFKLVEGTNIDFADYRNQLLFSYRALCCEIRKKEIHLETNRRILNSRTFSHFRNNAYFMLSHDSISVGIDGLNYYKCEIEKELFGSSNNIFNFKLYKYPFFPVCCNAIFTPLSKHVNREDFDELRRNPLDLVFISLLTFDNSLFVIIGNHKDKSKPWIDNYIKSWSNFNQQESIKEISNLLSTRIETWCMSVSLYNSIKEEKRNKFLEYWNKNYNNLIQYQSADFCLFN
jgi:hypothetical protein